MTLVLGLGYKWLMDPEQKDPNKVGGISRRIQQVPDASSSQLPPIPYEVQQRLQLSFLNLVQDYFNCFYALIIKVNDVQYSRDYPERVVPQVYDRIQDLIATLPAPGPYTSYLLHRLKLLHLEGVVDANDIVVCALRHTSRFTIFVEGIAKVGLLRTDRPGENQTEEKLDRIRRWVNLAGIYIYGRDAWARHGGNRITRASEARARARSVRKGRLS